LASTSRYHVSAGTYRICRKQPLLLQAFLGTCVGLALHCKTTGIGGIMHLLLPEPISAEIPLHPEKYALTGVPLFIEALVEAGARRETLSASIAGGALVGPLRRQDLDLDIGGRTVERVEKILKAEKIAITQSETGGFFTCCLNLDMSDGRVFIEPAGQSRIDTERKVRTASIEEIESAIDDLKPIPQVALKIMRLIGKNRFDIESIANEIRKDQVITARMLQLANSAMFGAKKRIASLDHAVIFLGRDLLVKLVLTAAVQGYYEQTGMGYALCKGGVYHHSLGCAQIAEILAKTTQRADPAEAYTAGLLHDIGKVALDRYVASAYPLFYRDLKETKDDILSIEQHLLGMDHTQVGGLLALRWSLPQPLEQVIRHHHHPDEARAEDQLPAMVFLADLLMSRFHAGLEIERIQDGYLNRHLDRLGLSHEAFQGTVDAIPHWVFTTME
jgi:putative nucleotidyltransferase with HDIG domain